jgi:mono/diheme cytochrome c family protein
VVYAGFILGAVALVPLALVARARVSKNAEPRIHLIPDMDHQPKLRAQQLNPLFADRREMRRPVGGTVARGELALDDHYYRGQVEGQWAEDFPLPVTGELMHRGQERFNIYCAPCHGLDGGGRGPVAVRADELQEGTWVPPLSFHEQQVLDRPVGHIFNTITRGIRTMPAYGGQIPVGDRWAIVAYVRALQRSQHASLDDVPADLRESLR